MSQQQQPPLLSTSSSTTTAPIFGVPSPSVSISSILSSSVSSLSTQISSAPASPSNTTTVRVAESTATVMNTTTPPALSVYGVFWDVVYLYTSPSVNLVISRTAEYVSNVNTAVVPTNLTLIASETSAASKGIPASYTTIASVTSWPANDALHLDVFTTPVTINLTPGSFATASGTDSPIPITGAAPSNSTFPSYSPGATAGIAVASLLGGLIVAALLACLVFKLKPRSGYRRPVRSWSSTGPVLSPGGRHHGSEMAAMRGTRSDSLLPAPMPERAIGREMSKLDTFIRNHAHSFFEASPDSKVRLSTSSDSDMAALLGSSSPVSGNTIIGLLASARTRASAVRFIIAWCILSGVQYSNTHSLLPAGLSGCMQQSGKSVDQLALAARWRQMTGALISDNQDMDAYQERAVNDLAARLNNVLKRYTAADNERQRYQNLKELVKQGAQFGMLLLSQPTAWTFDWQTSRRSDQLVMFPALEQTGDEGGHPLQRHMTYSDKQVLDI